MDDAGEEARGEEGEAHPTENGNVRRPASADDGGAALVRCRPNIFPRRCFPPPLGQLFLLWSGHPIWTLHPPPPPLLRFPLPRSDAARMTRGWSSPDTRQSRVLLEEPESMQLSQFGEMVSPTACAAQRSTVTPPASRCYRRRPTNPPPLISLPTASQTDSAKVSAPTYSFGKAKRFSQEVVSVLHRAPGV